jgi:hypothetical protein
MNDTLKAAGRIGAELGAAKAENERLRGLLRDLREITSEYAWDADLEARVDAALSQQAEPVEPAPAQPCRSPYCECDAGKCTHPGFYDARHEPAPAQDEREAFEAAMRKVHAGDLRHLESWKDGGYYVHHIEEMWQLWKAARPAQTEQQPMPSGFRVMWPTSEVLADGDRWEIYAPCGSGGAVSTHDVKDWVVRSLLDAMATANDNPITQTAPQGKFRMGDLVKKSSGSEWEGRVVGWYSTEQTPEGYAVESSAHRNSVQIYPAKALELLP